MPVIAHFTEWLSIRSSSRLYNRNTINLFPSGNHSDQNSCSAVIIASWDSKENDQISRALALCVERDNRAEMGTRHLAYLPIHWFDSSGSLWTLSLLRIATISLPATQPSWSTALNCWFPLTSSKIYRTFMSEFPWFTGGLLDRYDRASPSKSECDVLGRYE